MPKSSSEEDTDMSESELEEYTDKCYEQLIDGGVIVEVSDEKYRCPYCPLKKKQDYHYKELLQHAAGVGSSKSRSIKERGRHLGLVRYVEKYLGVNRPQLKATTEEKYLGLNRPQLKATAEGSRPPRSSTDVNELFVWPWVGIVANIPLQFKDGRYVGESGSRLREDLTRQGFNPVRVHPLWNYRGHSGYAIVEFRRDWHGFSSAMLFEKTFEADHRGKGDYCASSSLVSKLYGWMARDEDFHSLCIIGEHLRKSGDLKTIADIEAEEKGKATKLVSNLTNAIEVKNMRLREIECKYNETSMSISNLISQKDEMLQAYNDELRRMQQSAHAQLERISKEHEEITVQLEAQNKELNRREKELEKREAQNENETKKLYYEKEMNEKATLEQKKMDKNVLRLAENQKMEKEKLHKRIIELEKQLDAKQALELEIEHMRGAVLVMKHMGQDGDMELEKKIDAIQEDLKEKVEELDVLQELNQALIVKERKSNDELQEARKELIDFFREQSSQAIIGIKRMGELDSKIFLSATRRKYSEEADAKGMELCSLWDSYLRDPSWHPFKINTVDGGENHEEIINEEDEKLKDLRNDYGDEVYLAVTTALMEMNDYNPSGRYTIPELWNFKGGRKATLKEVVSYILKKWKARKGTKRRRN